MLARTLFTCRPTRNWPVSPSGPGVGGDLAWSRKSTTWGCGTTSASRPHRRRISAAAPGVSVMSASAPPDQHVELRVVLAAGRVVRVAQVVDGEDERSSARGGRRRRTGPAVRGPRVEAEVHVGEVEVVALRPTPAPASPVATSAAGRSRSPRPAPDRSVGPVPRRPRARGGGCRGGQPAPRQPPGGWHPGAGSTSCAKEDRGHAWAHPGPPPPQCSHGGAGVLFLHFEHHPQGWWHALRVGTVASAAVTAPAARCLLPRRVKV